MNLPIIIKIAIKLLLTFGCIGLFVGPIIFARHYEINNRGREEKYGKLFPFERDSDNIYILDWIFLGSFVFVVVVGEIWCFE